MASQLTQGKSQTPCGSPQAALNLAASFSWLTPLQPHWIPCCSSNPTGLPWPKFFLLQCSFSALHIPCSLTFLVFGLNITFPWVLPWLPYLKRHSSTPIPGTYDLFTPDFFFPLCLSPFNAPWFNLFIHLVSIFLHCTRKSMVAEIVCLFCSLLYPLVHSRYSKMLFGCNESMIKEWMTPVYPSLPRWLFSRKVWGFLQEAAKKSNAGLEQEREVTEEDSGQLFWKECAGWIWVWVGRHGEETGGR